MTYSILPTQAFVKDFKKVERSLQQRIKSKIEIVAKNPTRYKHLHYDLDGSSRIRIGKLRILFSYNVKKKELYVEKIVLRHKY